MSDPHQAPVLDPAAADRPTGLVQLRIHGVGGATPEGLLGLEHPEDVVRVAGDESAGFHARCAEPNVEGYVWGALTSGSAVQPLWIFLLPFTLYNVSGWMFPPDERLRIPALRPVARLAHWLVGVTLTLTYLLWLAELILQGTFYRPDSVVAGWVDRVLESAPFLGRSFDPTTHPAALGIARFWLGIAVLVVLGGLVWVVSGRTRRDYEGVRSKRAPAETREKPEPPPTLLGTPLGKSQPLDDPFFWRHSKDAERLATWHFVAAAALLVVIVVRAYPNVLHRSAFLGLGPPFTWETRAQVVLLLALLGVFMLTWKRGSDGFRFAAPVVVAAVSVGLATGFFSGLAALLKAGSLDLDLSAAFGVGTIAFLIGLVVWLVWHLVAMRPGLEEEFAAELNHRPYCVYPKGDQPPYGQEYSCMTWGMRNKLLAVRGLSQGIRNADLLLAETSGVFVVFATFAIWGIWTLPKGIATFGAFAVNAVVAAAIPLLVVRSRQPSARKKIGIIWDILTFWPRRHHPFAVRPYAERAVPEFEDRLRFHRANHARVVICAHSQGSVIAYAALRQLSDEDLGDLAFVTFGSPLYQLYARFFSVFQLWPAAANARRRSRADGLLRLFGRLVPGRVA